MPSSVLVELAGHTALASVRQQLDTEIELALLLRELGTYHGFEVEDPVQGWFPLRFHAAEDRDTRPLQAGLSAAFRTWTSEEPGRRPLILITREANADRLLAA